MTAFLTRAALPWFLCAILAGSSLGQTKTPPQSSRSDTTVLRVGIRDFKKLQGDSRLDVLEETLPQLLRAGLFYNKWLDVSLLGKGAAGDADTVAPSGGASKGLSSSGGSYDLIVEGEFLEVNETRIRVSIVVKDVLRRGIVFRDSVDLDRQQLLADMGQAADRIANTLRERVLQAKTSDRLAVVVGPFENTIADPKLSFLGTSLPLAISGNSEKAASGKNMAIQPVIPGVSASTSAGGWDIRVTGKISVVDGSILISGTYAERTGLTFSIEHSGPAAEPLKAVEGFSRKVWEVFAARIAPAGGFRNDPVLSADSSPEKLYARGQEYEKSGDDDVALFMYGMALRKKNDYLAARLRLADIYRQHEAYDLAEAQYAQVLSQNSREIDAYLGLGSLHSKQGNYEKAVQELEHALSLASSDPKVQFDTHMRLGEVYLLMKQPDRSIEHFLQAETANKTSTAPYLALGRAYRAKSDLDGAIDHLRKGLALWPGDKTLKNDLASALNALGKQRTDAKNYSKALEAYRSTIDLDPPDVHLKTGAYVASGIVWGWKLNDFTKGIALLEKAVELGPGEELKFRALGLAYEEVERYKDAIANLKKAIAIAPRFDSYRELAYIYRVTGEYDAGIENVKKALEIDSENADGYVLLGALYESKFSKSKDKKDDFRLGVENLKLAIQHDARNEVAHRILGVLYQEDGQYENAIDSLKQAIAIQPTVWAYQAIGECNWSLKKADDAIAAFTEALKLDRRYQATYDSLENVYSKTNQFDKFVQLLTETTQLQPNFVYAYIKLGVATRRQEKYEESVSWLEKAITLDRNNEWAYRVMGFTYSDIAQRDKADKAKSKLAYDKAIASLDRAIQLKPTEWSYTQLGTIYAALGENQKAIDNLEKSMQVNPRFEAAYETAEPIYDKFQRGEDFNRILESVVTKDASFYYAGRKLVDRYASLGRFDDVIELARKVIALKPDDAGAYWRLAQAERLKPNRDLARAYQDARKSIELDPTDPNATFTLAYVLFEQEKYAQAARELEDLVKQGQKSPLVLALMGNAYRQEKLFPKAYESSKQALALAPTYPYAYWVLGQTYADEKKYTEAISTAKEALKYNPEYGAALGLFYRTCHQLGKDQEAVQFMEQLLAQKPESTQILSALGFVYHEFIKDYQKAYEDYGKIYKQDPGDWSVVQNFAEANLTTDRLDAVLELTAKVLSTPDARFQSKLSMKLLQIAAYLLRGEQGRAFAELGTFRDDYSKVPKDYERGWTYEGTKNFVTTNSKLKPAERSLLLRMIDLLEARKEEADAKLKNFEASFAEIFADLKAAAAPGDVKKE